MSNDIMVHETMDEGRNPLGGRSPVDSSGSPGGSIRRPVVDSKDVGTPYYQSFWKMLILAAIGFWAILKFVQAYLLV